MPDRADNKYNILIVDDVPTNIQIVANILKSQGYSMAYAQSGNTAIELAMSNPFDLILLDIMMPEMDGFEVCRRLKDNPATKDIPVLFLTAKTETESIVQGFDTGAVDYVVKPVNEAELIARVKTHLALYSTRKKLMEMNRYLKKEIEVRKRAVRAYRDFYENAVQGMFSSTLSGRIINLNPAYIKILGYNSKEEVLAIKDVANVIYDSPKEREAMIKTLKRDGYLTNYELKIRRKDGSPAWVMMNSRLTKDDKGNYLVEGIVIDHTARKLAEEELKRSREKFRYQAIHDNLTGLYNTRYLYQALKKLLNSSKEKDVPFSLIFMDIDDFKHVVDTYGHLKGSQTLQEVAKTIQDCLKEPAYGVAYGGDEFVVVLPEFDKYQAIEKAGEIRMRIRETSYLYSKGHNIRISASFGVATFPDDAKDVTGLLALADKAMFHVKGVGKDGIKAIAPFDEIKN